MPDDRVTWAKVDRYFDDLLIRSDDQLGEVLASNAKASLPPIDVSSLQGKFLALLVQISGARRVLEIGTLGGYSTIWLARALPEDGRLVTLELSPHHAEVARCNLRDAHLLERVDVRVGPAVKSLETLARENGGPFDLVFIDADKESYPEYLRGALKLSRAGTLIVADNVVRNGQVADAACTDERVQGVRRFMELVAAEPQLSATVLQTVGTKGYDGLALAVVLS